MTSERKMIAATIAIAAFPIGVIFAIEYADPRLSLVLAMLVATGLWVFPMLSLSGRLTTITKMGVVVRSNLVLITQYSAFKYVRNRRAVVYPPGARVFAVLDMVYSRKTMERVFAPALVDMRNEHFAALAARRPWKAHWVVVAYHWSLVKMIPFHLLVALGKKTFELWTWFGTAM